MLILNVLQKFGQRNEKREDEKLKKHPISKIAIAAIYFMMDIKTIAYYIQMLLQSNV